jgi:hypothetical protein
LITTGIKFLEIKKMMYGKEKKMMMMGGKMKKEKMGYMKGGEVQKETTSSSQPVYGSTIANAMPKAEAN